MIKMGVFLIQDRQNQNKHGRFYSVESTFERLVPLVGNCVAL